MGELLSRQEGLASWHTSILIPSRSLTGVPSSPGALLCETLLLRGGMVCDEEEMIDSRGKNEGSCDKVIHSMRCSFSILGNHGDPNV